MLEVPCHTCLSLGVVPWCIYRRVQRLFRLATAAVVVFAAGRPANNAGSVLSRGRDSFRVLAEMPLMVMLLYQNYKGAVLSLVQQLAGAMMEALKFHATKADSVTHPTKFLEHVACQVSGATMLGCFHIFNDSVAGVLCATLHRCLPLYAV